jgi:hypothetical protein
MHNRVFYMNCPHMDQQPIGRRLIGDIERVVFQCQTCLVELIYQEPEDTDSSVSSNS